MLGGIFLYTGYIKLESPLQFAAILSGYKLFPDSLIVPHTYYFPWVEIALGILLLIGWKIRYVSLGTCGKASHMGAFHSFDCLLIFPFPETRPSKHCLPDRGRASASVPRASSRRELLPHPWWRIRDGRPGPGAPSRQTCVRPVAAALQLGIDRSTLYREMKAPDIEPPAGDARQPRS